MKHKSSPQPPSRNFQGGTRTPAICVSVRLIRPEHQHHRRSAEDYCSSSIRA
ncbi:hypothetical protein JYU34_006266, partial [Plutella xylostella]